MRFEKVRSKHSERFVLKSFLLYISLSIVCVASFQFYVYESGPPFHLDESSWLANSRALWLFLDGDFENEYWQGYDGWTQPHLAHYVYAVVLRSAGFGPDRLHKRYAPKRDLNWNIMEGRVPSKTVLLIGRRFSALCGALACLLVCEIGRRTFGWTVGLVAACWLALNPMMRMVCQRAMADGMLTFGLAGGVLLMIWLYQAWGSRSVRRVLLASIPVGVWFGLTASVKVNGAILCVIALGAMLCFIVELYVRKPGGEQPGVSRARALAGATASVMIVWIAAAETFYGINPQTWTRPIVDGTQYMLALRDRDVFMQQQHHPEAALTSVGQRCGMAVEMFFVRWPTLRTRPIEDFQNAYSAGDHRRGLWPIEGLLFLIGVGGLAARLIRWARRDHRIDPACILAVWCLCYSAFVFLAVPLLWPRYFQKYLLIQSLLVGIGVWVIVRSIGSLRAKRMNRSRDRTSGPAPA